jgi:hypothetical protein
MPTGATTGNTNQPTSDLLCAPSFLPNRNAHTVESNIMSLALVKSEIERFLADKEPAVLCITGAWGVGKTYAWSRYLRNAQTCRTIGLDPLRLRILVR